MGSIPKELTSGVVTKFQWGLCNETYCGRTVTHLVIRSGKQIGSSTLPNNKNKKKLNQRRFL